MQKKLRAVELVQIAICAAILYVSQVAFSFLPNIELVSPLIIVYTRNFGKKTLAIIYIFALIQGLTYGFGVWWINYLYVWTILYFIASAAKKLENPLGWAIIAAFFGLFFGLLCSIPYFFALGIGGGVSYFVNGIPFDLMHCAGNFVVTLLLFIPLDRIMKKADSFLSGK